MLPQSFFLVEVRPPNNQSTAFAGALTVMSLLSLRFSSAALSSEERLENLVLRLKLSLFMS